MPHYGSDAIKSNIGHFLTGKALAAVSSVTVLVFVARTLAVPQFAAYAVFQALISLVGTISDFGVGQTIVRYVPELRVSNNNRAMYRLIFRGAAIRMPAIAVTLGLAWLVSSRWAPQFNLEPWLPWLIWYLPVGWLRLSNIFVFRAMESLMWQKVTQYSVAGGALLRLGIVSWLIWQDSVSLQNVILMELFSEGLIFMSLLLGFYSRWHSDANRHMGDRDWPLSNRARLRRFATWGYMQGLANLLYGGSANRMAASGMLLPFQVGLFGFVDSLTDYGQRYLPTRVLHGMIQPLFFARYSQTHDFRDMGRLANMTFRFSLIALGLPTVVLLAGGEALVNWLTADKYGQAAHLVAGMMLVLSMESLRSQIEVMIQAVERNEVFLLSNLALSGSLPVALVLVPHLGLWSFVIGSGVGNVLSLLVMTVWLSKLGLGFHLDWSMIFRSLVTICSSGFVGVLLATYISLWLGIFLSVLFYALITWIWPPLRPMESSMLVQLIRRKRDICTS